MSIKGFSNARINSVVLLVSIHEHLESLKKSYSTNVLWNNMQIESLSLVERFFLKNYSRTFAGLLSSSDSTISIVENVISR